MAPATIASLPPELLALVFHHVAETAPSEVRLHDQPKTDFLQDPNRPLKHASLVSWHWRTIALPILFCHVVWTLDWWDMYHVVEQGRRRDPFERLPLLGFLSDRGLGRHVDTLTIIITNHMRGTTSSPPPTTGSQASGSSSHLATYFEDNNWVWDLLFSVVDPRRFTLVATPKILARLLSRMLFIGDAWSFNINPLHVLSLSRPTKGPLPSSSSSSSPPPTTTATSSKNPNPPQAATTRLFTIRPWTGLLLNEGSSTRVYRTYEFFLRRPPSILGALLGSEEAPNDTLLIPRTVTSLSYVAIFPLSSHFTTLVSHLPRLDRLFVQLVPQDDLLLSADEMHHVQPSDLWMERNSCYSLAISWLMAGPAPVDDEDFDMHSETEMETEEHEVDAGGGPQTENNWRHLREFASGDAADVEAWEMAVKTLCGGDGSQWRVEREGVFVRRGQQQDGDDEAMGEAPQQASENAPDIFHPALQRLAFNGTANLPYSPVATHWHGHLAAPPPAIPEDMELAAQQMIDAHMQAAHDQQQQQQQHVAWYASTAPEEFEAFMFAHADGARPAAAVDMGVEAMTPAILDMMMAMAMPDGPLDPDTVDFEAWSDGVAHLPG
ncbi:F-box domain-containing protein [Podospora appendiculata]|uniref:F-box domain-containing protein n=1 Tax=Podospora appendiculata TaxID=314037 RepID=A0AAE0WZJ4_9PEZI|nr:F-box domain-containing protein [Podospora appendiculata]